MPRHVYLDWNATTPPHPAVLEAMRAAADIAWANPASVHGPGRRARAFIEEAREAVAALVGMDPRDVVLTSGGTEANNLALALPFADILDPSATTSPAIPEPALEPKTDTNSAQTRGATPGLAARGRGRAPRLSGNPAATPRVTARDDGRAPHASANPAATPRVTARDDGRAARDAGRRAALLVSRIEHPSVVRMAEELALRGVLVEWVTPDPSGVVPAAAFAAAAERLRPTADVRLIALQAVNHETGVIQPVAEVAKVAATLGALLHVDAVQAVGRLPQSAWSGADMVSVASHKIRGPKGVGALCTRPGLKVRPLLFGGAQERGLRPGTQDPSACAGFTIAARLAHADGPARYAMVQPLRDHLEAEMLSLGAIANGAAQRGPHVTNLSWPGWRGDELCAALDLEGLAVSSGSACSAGTAEPSPVLRAMLGVDRASSAVRISLGEDTTLDDVARALVAFQRVLARR